MFMFGGCGGSVVHVDVKSEGDRTEPWGTPLGNFFACDDLPLNDMCDCLPPK